MSDVCMCLCKCEEERKEKIFFLQIIVVAIVVLTVTVVVNIVVVVGVALLSCCQCVEHSVLLVSFFFSSKCVATFSGLFYVEKKERDMVDSCIFTFICVVWAQLCVIIVVEKFHIFCFFSCFSCYCWATVLKV